MVDALLFSVAFSFKFWSWKVYQDILVNIFYDILLFTGGIKKIEPALYKKYVDTEFGRQYVNSLQLCPMMKKKAKSGYYDVEYTVQFGEYKGQSLLS